LLNGVDDSFHDEGPRPEDPFRIVYAGTIYIDRDPRTLLAAVGTVVRDLSIPQGALEVEFIGNAETFMGMPTEKLARDAGIEACFRLIPAMPRSQLLEHLKRAAVLVSLPQSTPWSMPSKVYEYMGFSARLLVYAEPGTATAEVLADSDAVVLRPDDLEGTVEALKRCYAEHRDGVTERRAGNAREFARSQGGRQLQGLLLELGWTVDGVATVGQGSLDLV
jgi:glycosyltransferase involved in cell wall biosynthesis